MKFRIKLEGEWELDAADEEDARSRFFEDIVYDTQSDPASLLDSHLKVEAVEEDEEHAEGEDDRPAYPFEGWIGRKFGGKLISVKTGKVMVDGT